MFDCLLAFGPVSVRAFRSTPYGNVCVSGAEPFPNAEWNWRHMCVPSSPLWIRTTAEKAVNSVKGAHHEWSLSLFLFFYLNPMLLYLNWVKLSNLYNTAAETITIVTQGSLWGATDSVLYSRVFRHCKQPTMGPGCNLAVFAMTTLQNHIWTQTPY